MDPKIRQYRESNRGLFVKFMEELHDHLVSVDDMRRLRRMPGYGESYTRERLKKIAENDGAIYIAESGGQPIGLVAGIMHKQTKRRLLEAAPTKDGEILELFVAAGYRRKGVGTMLVGRMEEYFKRRGCDASMIGVFVPNKEAHRLYVGLGYHDRSTIVIKKMLDAGKARTKTVSHQPKK